MCSQHFTPKILKYGQIHGLSKNGSWALVDACGSFFLNHELMDAQEALEMGQIYKFGFDLLEEVGHTTKCCDFGRMKFFWANFFRSLIRACTGSFANV